MIGKVRLRPAAALLALGWAWLPGMAAAQDCDRVCLHAMVTRYIDALVAHDPAALPLAEGAKFTEDSQPLDLGEGLWKTVSGKASFRHDYLDTKAHVAAAHVALVEAGQPVLYSLALHMDGQTIAGIETLVQRITPESPFQPTELGRPVRGLDDAVPAGQRMARADMVATALGYTEGLRIGSFTSGGTRFAADAYRVENGVITAGAGCGRADCGMYAQRIIVHPAIVPSVVAVDEANGTVLLWMNFGDTGSYGENRALVAYEAFKVWGGQIHAINAFFTLLPANTPRFWDSADPLPHLY